MGERNERGLFAVRLPVEDGEIKARLTGVHYGAVARRKAYEAVARDERVAMTEGRSPTYLVPDSVVGLARNLVRRCDDPQSKDDAFAGAVIWGLDLPGSGLGERLEDAVGAAIGMTWSDAPWNGAMSEEEVDEVFEELGVPREKQQEGESHGTH